MNIDGPLLREVARVQHEKTLLAVRDLIDSMAVTKPNPSRSWDPDPISAASFRTDLVRRLQAMRIPENGA